MPETEPILRTGTVGVLPVGALGAAFFHHLTGGLTRPDAGVFFVRRPGSSAGDAQRDGAVLRFERPEAPPGSNDAVRELPVARYVLPDPVALASAGPGRLPEALLVVTNTDQVLGVIDACVRTLEIAHARNPLTDPPVAGGDAPPPFPLLLLAANGIYFLQMRQMLVERLEESTLFGRLPDLWPDLMPRIVGRMMRGVTLQTGLRDGDGPDAVFRPGPPGLTRICGGDAASRRRLAELLVPRGGRWEVVDGHPPTRVEFDKALVNLSANLLGQRLAVGPDGRFRMLTIAEILTPDLEPAARELAGHVFRIGRAVRAYPAGEDFESTVLPAVFRMRATHGSHVPSSLQYIAARVRSGKWTPHITPTESWLLDPLIRYARSAELADSVAYLESLRADLLDRLGRITGVA